MAVMNGNGPMNAGHQMDLHHLYDMVLELSDVLKNNREVTKNIVSSAEEIMVRLVTTSIGIETELTGPNRSMVPLRVLVPHCNKSTAI